MGTRVLIGELRRRAITAEAERDELRAHLKPLEDSRSTETAAENNPNESQRHDTNTPQQASKRRW